MRFPCGCICRKNFFNKTETTDTTDTTIWKPGLTRKPTVYLDTSHSLYCHLYLVFSCFTYFAQILNLNILVPLF